MEKEKTDYLNIDMKRTGMKLRFVMENAGYDVKTIQEYLHLSCPQPIYRWFKGIVLPSVNHLYMLSVLTGIHMEELLVPEQTKQKEALLCVMEKKKILSGKKWLPLYGEIWQKAVGIGLSINDGRLPMF